MLFNLALEHVIRNSGIDTSATLTNKSKQIVGYADDLNILGRSVPSIKEAFGNLETGAKDLNLKVNEHKTKFLLQSRKHRVGNGQNITIGNYNFEGVNNFTYLGSNVSSDDDETKEIRKRIDAANRAFYSLLPVFKSKNVYRETKIKFYKTLIRTFLTYGSEKWTKIAKSAELLDSLERRMLRRIYGPVNSEGIWRIRWNHEISELYKEPKISTHIKLMRLWWAGHVQRMPETRVARKVFLESVGGKRPVGKPRARWEDNVSKDTRDLLGIRNWREQSRDQDEWRRKIDKAKAQLGL
ncbi:hypothetical protein J437_LFUL012751 [Ladona fulva]|uniref:Reverse transcriptase domain-containing protein n=1 Tax=Ladona fulva TaxID=123851 RepID=A0A8K0KTC2_LADFU|nr:hypothetical protein J437_LFUL012751 [Ladona fulva]